MYEPNNEDLEIPFYDPNPRRVLFAYSKKIKEEPIKDDSSNEGQIKASPPMLALITMLSARDHLNLILDNSSKIGGQINQKQKTKIYLELLVLYFFLIGQQIGKYLHGDQFTLFVLKFHVELLDKLPKSDMWWLFGTNPFTRSKKIKEIVGEDSWKTGLSSYIFEGERFYIKNKLNDEEAKTIINLKSALLDSALLDKDFKENSFIQFLIKNCYLLTKILNLSLPENLSAILSLYLITSFPILNSQERAFQNIKPVWNHKIG